MDINEPRDINLIAKLNATSGPYYSSHGTLKGENSIIEASPRSISNPEYDFIDINNLLGHIGDCVEKR